MSKGSFFWEGNVGLWPALLRASCLLLRITILGVGARGIGTVKVEKAQVFFSKSGLSSHTLHYSNIKQDFKVKELEQTLKKVQGAVQRRAKELYFFQPLHNNETRSGHFMEDPTVFNSEKVAHRVEYRLNALLSRVSRLFELFKPVNNLIEDFALMNPKETADLTFKHRHPEHGSWLSGAKPRNGHRSGQSGSTRSGRSGSSRSPSLLHS
jgi:hypothetical protein